MAKRRVGIIAFLFSICMYLIPCPVQAASTTDAKEPISTDKECSLTISYCCNESVFEEMVVKLYKVADVSFDYQYTLTPSFDASNQILNGVKNTGEWNVICSTMESYIIANEVEADYVTATNEEGHASFEMLTPGLYLAVTDPIVQNKITYVFESALIALPGLSPEGFWQYQITVAPKSQMIHPSGKNDKIEFNVLKLWKGDNAKSDRPQKVEIEIFCNGISYRRVTLSEDNYWSYYWSAKDDGSNWKVVERNIPSQYTATIEKRDTTFILTNTLTGDDSNKTTTPQTGDTSGIMLYIVLMIVSGSVFIFFKYYRNEKTRIAMKKNSGVRKAFTMFGVCLLLTASVILFMWQWGIHTSGKQAKVYVDAICELIPKPQGTIPEERRDNTMSVLSVEGSDFVGMLELPQHESVLPVCADWGRLTKYPCRLGGSVYDCTIQIGGTSQKGQYDFYRNISVGDNVFFTDMEGNRFAYIVTDIQYEKNADQTTLQQKEAALTLFIKNIYAFEYIIVYCNIDA